MNFELKPIILFYALNSLHSCYSLLFLGIFKLHIHTTQGMIATLAMPVGSLSAFENQEKTAS